ncbi:MAG: hypothetical protein H6Q75_727 [Firmicutes bacterium]|nr:hypothetical protein [Bacillota bacterium]
MPLEIRDILAEIDHTCQKINVYRPFAEPMLSQLKAYYRIGLTYSSNALEGNSLTETETKVVLEDGLTVGGKPLRDHLEAMGHSEAYDFMFSLMHGNLFTEQDILTLHRMFYSKIDEGQAGRYRRQRVFISGSQYAVPDWPDVPLLMAKWLQELPAQKKKLHPVELAAKVHKDYVFIHPFVDGNGRVARLLTNLVLIQAGYLLVIIPPIIRADYISSLEKAHTDDADFQRFIAERVLETQKDYLRLLK